MKVLYNLDDTLEICKSYFDGNAQHHVDFINSDFEPPISFIQSGPWEQSYTALNRTLKYVFDYLHHSCYILCSNGNTSTIYKLESMNTAPLFKTVLENELKSLDKNATLDASHRNNIRDNLGKHIEKLRILQCIVKQISKKTTVSSEYENFVKDIQLPRGVYILNLTDANLLHKESLHPFPVFRGKNPTVPKEFQHTTFIPIFSLSGNVNYYDIPIPNYDDVNYVSASATYNIDDFHTSWQAKSFEKAVFRGGPSGCGYTVETNQRLKLAELGKYSDDLDVGIVSSINSENATIDSNSIRFDPAHGLGMLNTGIKSVNRLSYVEQSNYKYIIHVDGNVNAYRLLSIMATGSLILRVKSQYTSWFDHLIQENTHYIGVRADLSDLEERVKWCKMHDFECSRIASNALKFARHVLLNADFVRGAFQKNICIASYYDIPEVQKMPTMDESSSKYYTKKEGEKCKKGYIQDKKDKMKCIFSTTNKTKKIKIGKSPEMVKSPVIRPKSPTEDYDLVFPEQAIIENEKSRKSLVDDFYLKGEGEKRCKKGYIQDKKDKNKCITSTTTRKVKSAEKVPERVLEKVPDKMNASPLVLAINQRETLPETTQNEANFYIKSQDEKRCKKGYTQDKKDNTKCISSGKNVLPVPKKMENVVAKPMKSVVTLGKPDGISVNITRKKHTPIFEEVNAISDQKYSDASNVRKKCDTIKNKIREIF